MCNSISIKDLALACGVSTATISKALNNHKDVSYETKERVCRKAKEMGYIPNYASKILRTNRTYNIGVVFYDECGCGLTNDFFAMVLDGFKTTIEENGYDFTFVNKKGYISSWDNSLSYLEHCKFRRFDGVAVICADFYSPEIIELIKSNIPIVTFDHVFNDRSAVVSDTTSGIRDLVRYVYSMGHRRIAYIHGNDSAVTRNRISSFCKTCEELKIEIPSEYLVEAPYRDTTQTYIKTRELLGLRTPPTCIMFPDDYAYIGGFNAITLAGLKVPNDISAVGYDGIEIGKHLEPALTTLVQDAHRLGMETAKKLIDTIEHPRTSVVEHIYVKGKISVGQSVKKLDG